MIVSKNPDIVRVARHFMQPVYAILKEQGSEQARKGDTMNCEYCGSELKAGMTHCAACDAAVDLKKDRTAGVWFYMFPAFFLLTFFVGVVCYEQETVLGKIGFVLFMLSLLVNPVVSILFCRPQNMKRLFVSGAIIKYAMLLPYLLCLIAAGLSGLLTFLSFIPVPFMITFLIMGPLGMLICFLISCVISWFGASYVISFCVAARNAGYMSAKECTIHILLQLLCVTSFVDIIILTVRYRGYKKT